MGKWQYAVDKGASVSALSALEDMCVEYEAEHPFIERDGASASYLLNT